jgi:hypothetical protein
MPNLTTTGEAAVGTSGELHARASLSSTGVLPSLPPGGTRRVVQLVARAALYDALTISGAPAGSPIGFLGVLTGTATATAIRPAQALAFPYQLP